MNAPHRSNVCFLRVSSFGFEEKTYRVLFLFPGLCFSWHSFDLSSPQSQPGMPGACNASGRSGARVLVCWFWPPIVFCRARRGHPYCWKTLWAAWWNTLTWRAGGWAWLKPSKPRWTGRLGVAFPPHFLPIQHQLPCHNWFRVKVVGLNCEKHAQKTHALFGPGTCALKFFL